MRFVHRDFSFEINDDWWNEAGMSQFVPASLTYRVDLKAFPNVFEVRIDDVIAPRRQLSHGSF
jgi:hypothetical protein